MSNQSIEAYSGGSLYFFLISSGKLSGRQLNISLSKVITLLITFAFIVRDRVLILKSADKQFT